MFDTAHKISQIRKRMLLPRIESPLANWAALSCRLSQKATSSLLRMEKHAPQTGFGEMGPALRANPRVVHANGAFLIYFCETHSLCLIPDTAFLFLIR
jgi:hypothetical protein